MLYQARGSKAKQEYPQAKLVKKGGEVTICYRGNNSSKGAAIANVHTPDISIPDFIRQALNREERWTQVQQ